MGDIAYFSPSCTYGNGNLAKLSCLFCVPEELIIDKLCKIYTRSAAWLASYLNQSKAYSTICIPQKY